MRKRVRKPSVNFFAVKDTVIVEMKDKTGFCHAQRISIALADRTAKFLCDFNARLSKAIIDAKENRKKGERNFAQKGKKQ